MRIFACIGFSVLAALFVAFLMGGMLSIAVGALCVLAFVWLAVFARIRGKKLKDYAILSVALLSASLAFFVFGIAYEPAEGSYDFLDGETAYIKGRLVEYPEESYGNMYYTLRVEAVYQGSEKLEVEPFCTRLSSSYPLYVKLYDYIYCDATFYNFSEEGTFSTRDKQRARGVDIGSYVNGRSAQRVIAGGRDVSYYIKLIRHDMTKLVRESFSKETAAVINAMVLGDRSEISQETVMDFRKTGLSHVLVVSGFHVSVVAGFMLLLLRALGLKKRYRNIITIVMIALFMMINGFGVSVVRSGIMLIMMLVAEVAGRERDSLNSLGLAVLVMCVINPAAAQDVGFIMSVLATLGILIFSDKLEASMMKPLENTRASRFAKPIISAFSVSISATLALLPFQIYTFGTLSLVAPLASTIFMPLASVVIYLALPALMFVMVGGGALIPLLALLLTGAVKLLLGANHMLSSLDGIYIHADGFLLTSLVFVVIIAAYVLLVKPRKDLRRAAYLLAVVLVVFGTVLGALKYRDVVTLAVLDEGDESCVLMMKNGEAAVLTLGGYDESAAATVLAENNIKKVSSLNLLANTHDVTYAAEKILKDFDVSVVSLAEEVYIGEQIANAGAELKIAKPGDYTSFGTAEDKMQIKYLEGAFCVSIYGREVMIETDEAEGSCDVLISNNLESSVISAFTVWQTSDIINVAAREEPFVVTGERAVTYLDFYKNGKFMFRRGS